MSKKPNTYWVILADPQMEDVAIKLRTLKAEVGQYYDEGPEYDPDALDSYR